jgi:hypothetical protein
MIAPHFQPEMGNIAQIKEKSLLRMKFYLSQKGS